MPDLFSATTKKKSILTTDPDLPKGLMHFFTNFRLFPEGVTVENQEPDETIVLFLRRDFSTNIPWILISILLLFLPFLLTFLPDALSLSFLPTSFFVIFNLFYYLLVIGYVIINFSNWFYNMSLVTNQRVFDLDYANITYKHVSSTIMRNIKDVSYVQAGFFRSFFDFGDVRVQTEAEIPNFLFDSVPRPAKVEDIVLDLIRGASTND